MFPGDESGEKIDLKENNAPSCDCSFILRLGQKRPFVRLDSTVSGLCERCLAANNDLGDDMSANGEEAFQRLVPKRVNEVQNQKDSDRALRKQKGCTANNRAQQSDTAVRVDSACDRLESYSGRSYW